MWKASDSDCSLSFMGKKLSVLLLWLILGLSLLMLPAFPAQAEVTSYLSGNEANVNPTLAAPVLDLGGGGTDVEKALQWTLDQVRGCTGANCSKTVDVVVIRFEKDNPRTDDSYDGYNKLIYDEMGHIGVDSVETLVFQRRHREDANKPELVDKIKNAEVIFFAGGDQCKYARNFKNTGVEAAVKSVYARGGGIGGTSAGAMIQGNFIFNACTEDEVETPEALEDPYEDIFFTENLFQWKYFQNTLIDTHFVEDDRMGRTMAFVARLLRDGLSESPLAIGIDSGTSLAVDQKGIATVMGKGPVYFILGDHLPEECEPQTDLTFSNFKIWKVNTGETFNLKDRPTTGYYLRSVRNGHLSPDPYLNSQAG